MVDQKAKQAVNSEIKRFKAIRDPARKSVEETHLHYPKIIQFLCTTSTELLDSRKKDDDKEAPRRTLDFTYLIPQGPYVTHPCDLPEEDILSCPYNAKFAREVVTWLSKLQWPADHCEATGPISLIELYTDFCLSTGLSTPVQIIPPSQRTRGTQVQYHLRSEHVLADTAPMNLSDQSKTWTRSLQWVCKRATWYNQLQFFQARSLVDFWL